MSIDYLRRCVYVAPGQQMDFDVIINVVLLPSPAFPFKILIPGTITEAR